MGIWTSPLQPNWVLYQPEGPPPTRRSPRSRNGAIGGHSRISVRVKALAGFLPEQTRLDHPQ